MEHSSNSSSNSNLEARLEGLTALLDSGDTPMGFFFCAHCSKTFASPDSLRGYQNAHRMAREAESFQSLVQRPHFQTSPADDTFPNAAGDDQDHQSPVLSPLPISFIPPPPSDRRHSFIPRFGTCLDAGDPFLVLSRAAKTIRAFQAQLLDRFRSRAETNQDSRPS